MSDAVNLMPLAARPIMNNSSEPDDFERSMMDAQAAAATPNNPFMSATMTEDTAEKTPVARLQAGLANEGFRY